MTLRTTRSRQARDGEASSTEPRRWDGILALAAGTASLQAFSNGMGFILSVVLARTIGRAGYGSYALAIAWAGFLTLPALLGFDRFLVRGMAVYASRSQWPWMKGLLRRANQLVIVTSFAIATVGVVIALTVPRSSERIPLALAMLLIPLTALTTLRQAAMQALHRVVRGQVPEFFIRPILILLAVGTVWLIHPSALTSASAVAINVSAVAVAFVVGALWLRRTVPAQVRTVAPVYATSTWLRSAVPMMVVAGIWTLNNYASVLIVGALAGPRAAGVFTVADNAAALTALVLVAANMPLAPAIARLHAQNETRELERTTVRVARAGLLVSIPIAAAFALFPGLYLRIFGHGFGVGATAVTILALGQLVNAAAGPAGNVLLMTGHERQAAFGVGLGLIANVCFGVILVPLLGVTGAAIGTSASLVVWNVTLLIMARRYVGINASAFRALNMRDR
jgi:O-antigen/teichoic acid export membrane protein